MSAISRSKPKHRAADKVAELKQQLKDQQAQTASAFGQLIGAADTIAILEADLADVRVKRAEAEQVVTRLDADLQERTAERDQALTEASRLRAQLAPYLAADANTNAITVPPSERDTTAFEDQATEPIKVTTLREAFGIGPVVATQGSADPAHLPAA
ncbi:hypothetical protein GTY83_07315 [Streptomyces sp. SID4928]|uniref:hypothetical protein n=1 Tax=unclassified Streptomyces TaxID=2593676 RepID=UPI0001C1C402|nr:hypothetical protein [Streptomyces sp. ACT-1]EGE40849.1 hypothetical protein SACT1_1484 [Streptomyces sp. ACT-1]MYR48914.1 hypothetical protein [Streptomyces sp. SID4928]